MFALISEQGTACAETALCQQCYAVPGGRAYASEMGSQADDIPNVTEFHDCSENDALECCICGAAA